MQNIVVFTCIYHDEEKNRAVTNVGFIIRLFQQMNILYSLKFRFRHANIDFQPAHKPQHQRLLGPPNLSRGQWRQWRVVLIEENQPISIFQALPKYSDANLRSEQHNQISVASPKRKNKTNKQKSCFGVSKIIRI